MPCLIWTPPALRDVQRLYRFLASQNSDAASKAIKAIRDGVKVLALQPAMGRPVDEMAPEFREWLIDFGHSGYVTLYRHEDDSVTLLAVRHQKESGYQD